MDLHMRVGWGTAWEGCPPGRPLHPDGMGQHKPDEIQERKMPSPTSEVDQLFALIQA